MLKNLSHFVRVMLIISIVLDFSGLAFGLFYEGIFYDNLAHLLTSLVLVALAMELAHLRGVLPSLISGSRALAWGAVVGLVGGGAWEIVEIAADYFFPGFIYNPPFDTAMDIAFGTLGGAVGAWRTNAYLRRHAYRLITVDYSLREAPAFGSISPCLTSCRRASEKTLHRKLVSGNRCSETVRKVVLR